MKKYIVTTTIQSPTEATIKFSKMNDWHLIVVGDKKTPHDKYKNINCTYLGPDLQENKYKKLSNFLGWNTIQRRNIGFLYAYECGADIVATVDDDNIPYEHWGKNLLVNQNAEIDVWESSNGFFEPLSITNYKNFWHRGYPIEKVHDKNNVTYLGKKNRTVLVQADLWDGDPDVDAMVRMPHKPNVKFNITQPFASNQISPFNSQNTFISRHVLPYYMVLPFVGRMDDIWGGYNLFRYFKDFLIYSKSTVFQDRNKQDLTTNLEKEIIGYRNTLNLLENQFTLEEISPKAFEAYELYKSYFK